MARTDAWIIVGGGASGLAAAFFLRQLGMRSVIVEREATIGGRMGTVALGGRSLDCGGKNIGRQYKLFRQFAASLGDHPFEYFGLNSSQVVDGKITTFDSNARWRTLMDVARGVSAKDMVRFAAVLARVKANPANGYLGSQLSHTLGRRYDHSPLSRYFSPEFCRRILRPMTVRMNGAEPDEVYMGSLASNVRMILDTYEQFKHGLAPLLSSFAGQYDVHFDTTTEGLILNERGRVSGIRVRHANGWVRELHGAGVILATPASVSARLTESVFPGLSRQLGSVAYYPVTLALAEYEKPVFSSSVRALVFDANEALSNAGAYGVNDLNVVRYTFSGRASRDHIANSVRDEDLLRMGEATLSRCVSFDARGRRRFVVKRFTQGLCAYTPYHGRFMDSIGLELKKSPGLYLTGDYMQGASIEACFRAAQSCVNRLARAEEGAVAAGARELELQTSVN